MELAPSLEELEPVSTIPGSMVTALGLLNSSAEGPPLDWGLLCATRVGVLPLELARAVMLVWVNDALDESLVSDDLL